MKRSCAAMLSLLLSSALSVATASAAVDLNTATEEEIAMAIVEGYVNDDFCAQNRDVYKELISKRPWSEDAVREALEDPDLSNVLNTSAPRRKYEANVNTMTEKQFCIAIGFAVSKAGDLVKAIVAGRPYQIPLDILYRGIIDMELF